MGVKRGAVDFGQFFTKTNEQKFSLRGVKWAMVHITSFQLCTTKSYQLSKSQQKCSKHTICNKCNVYGNNYVHHVYTVQVNVTPDDSSAEILSCRCCVELMCSGGKLTNGGAVILDRGGRLLQYRTIQCASKKIYPVTFAGNISPTTENF